VADVAWITDAFGAPAPTSGTLRATAIVSGGVTTACVIVGRTEWREQAVNSGTVMGGAEFSGTARNDGSVYGDAVFLEQARNDDTVAGSAAFFDAAENGPGGAVSGVMNLFENTLNYGTNSGLMLADSTNNIGAGGVVYGAVLYRTASTMNLTYVAVSNLIQAVIDAQ
jgi:hypothetical protein